VVDLVKHQNLTEWFAMPNTPALVHAGITGLHAQAAVGESDRKAAEGLLAAVGATLWFDAEGDLDAVTAVSGSGPAYVFYAIEALETAARRLATPARESIRRAHGTKWPWKASRGRARPTREPSRHRSLPALRDVRRLVPLALCRRLGELLPKP